MTSKYLYVNNTNLNVAEFHKHIAEACNNDGKLPDEIADIFKLTKCPEGSDCLYRLDMM